jgi:hypothetical protein
MWTLSPTLQCRQAGPCSHTLFKKNERIFRPLLLLYLKKGLLPTVVPPQVNKVVFTPTLSTFKILSNSYHFLLQFLLGNYLFRREIENIIIRPDVSTL